MKTLRRASLVCWLILGLGQAGQGQEKPPEDGETPQTPATSSAQTAGAQASPEIPFPVPLPAHAARRRVSTESAGFQVIPGRDPSPAKAEEESPVAEYRLADSDEKPPITPDLANLNLAEDLELVTLDTKEKVFLPAGTYRQILRIPIDSPAMQSAQKTREERRPAVKPSRLPPPDPGPKKEPLWIRYESLEKIKINDEERRGGLDLPINGPSDLKVRLWYAKSETADAASSVFYFVFGGLGYSAANLLGWSAGNTREIPGDFEYRLIRR